MDYQNVIRDFAERTRRNLAFIEKSLEEGADVYEITQLVNSLLGLIVFPQQRYVNSIPKTSLEDLRKDGWPEIKVAGKFKPHKNLNELIRYLRNAISHFNIEFLVDQTNQLLGVRVWNIDTRKPNSPKTWEAEISFEDLKIIIDKFIDLILKEKVTSKKPQVPPEFWDSLMEKARKRTALHAHLRPKSTNNACVNAGLSRVDICYLPRKGSTLVALRINRKTKEENKKIFNQLLPHKRKIEEVFKGPLEWDPEPGSRITKIQKRVTLIGTDNWEDWDEIQEKMVDAMIRLEKALRPYLDKVEI